MRHWKDEWNLEGPSRLRARIAVIFSGRRDGYRSRRPAEGVDLVCERRPLEHGTYMTVSLFLSVVDVCPRVGQVAMDESMDTKRTHA